MLQEDTSTHMSQRIMMNEHIFELIGTKNQLADILTKSGTPLTSHLYSQLLYINVNILFHI